MNNPPSEMLEPPPSLREFLEMLDDRLKSAGTSYAEQAFGIGCSISLIPLGLLLLVSFLLGARNGISLGLVAIIGVLIAIAIASWVANRARLGAIQQTFQRDILPEINVYLQSHEMGMDEFHAAVVELMPEGAPLRQLITQKAQSDPSLLERSKI